MANVLTNAGRAILTNRISGSGTEPNNVGFGTGAGTSAASNTTLFTEDYSDANNGTGNQRVAGTASQQTTSVTNDTWQNVATLEAQHSTAVTNAGCFDSLGTAGNLTTAPSGGNLFLKSDFSTVNLNTSDSIQFTFQLQFT